MKGLNLYFIICLMLCTQFSIAQTWHTFAEDSLFFSIGTCPTHCPSVQTIYLTDNSIYVGGVFDKGGEVELASLGYYKNGQWFGLEVSTCIGIIYCITKYENKLFVGGTWYPNWMSELRYLSFWDGSSWNPPGDIGCAGRVSNFKIHNDTLFVCGAFVSIDGTDGMSVMAYDNNDWINIGSINVANANALEVYNDEMLCGTRYLGIYKRTGATSWEHFPGEPSGSVNDMVVDTTNNLLYVGGVFHYVDNDNYSRNVAMWDGFEWHSLDSGVLHGDVNKDAMAIYRGDLYIGGIFDSTSNGLPVNYIARWDGSNWNNLGNGCNNWVFALSVYNDTLIVGGDFSEVGDSQRALALAKWHMPDTGCNYLRPIVYAYEEFGTAKDTFQLSDAQAEVSFYNNNAYADTWEWNFDDTGSSDIKNPTHSYNEIGEYNVQITVTDGECVKTANRIIYIEEKSGIKKHEAINIQVFPNPSHSNFTVKLEQFNYENTELSIVDTNGKLKCTITVTSDITVISTKGWCSGTYNCNLFVDGKLVSTENLIFLE